MTVAYDGKVVGKEDEVNAGTLVQRLSAGDNIHEPSGLSERIYYGYDGKELGKIIYEGDKVYAVRNVEVPEPLSKRAAYWSAATLGLGVGAYLWSTGNLAYIGTVLGGSGFLGLLGAVTEE